MQNMLRIAEQFVDVLAGDAQPPLLRFVQFPGTPLSVAQGSRTRRDFPRNSRCRGSIGPMRLPLLDLVIQNFNLVTRLPFTEFHPVPTNQWTTITGQ